MAISKCISLSDKNKIETSFSDAALHVNETGYHGTVEFPVAIYLDDVSHEYVNWHWHEEFEIGFVTKGSVILGCGSRIYQLNCGDIFFINSNVLHSMHKNIASSQASFKSIAFHSSIICERSNSIFYTKYLLPILSNSMFKECVITGDNIYHKSMSNILEKVWNLVCSEESDYEITVRNELSNISCILKKIQDNMEDSITNKFRNYQSEKRVQILLDYIHTHYKDKITIEELARTATISKTEVLRCFKTIVGVSPIRYLNSYRLQRATYMLVNTEISIQEIAEECGFDDNSYFSKLFNKKYHVSPHNYRKQNNQ